MAGAGVAVVASERLTVLEVLRRSTSWLGDRGVENPRLDAELLVAHGLGMGRLQLYLAFDRPLTVEERDRVRALVRERGRHVPVAYLTGEREFFSLPFHVDEHVLVPRPETELLVETALPALREGGAPVFLDVGTGSGCISVALLHEAEAARGHATEISRPALGVAKRNAERHGVLDRLELHEGDLLEPLRTSPDWGHLDVVVSNPPYVLEDDDSVERGVRDHEPRAALFVSGHDSLEVARRVADGALHALRVGGLLALEIGYDAGADARRMLEAFGYAEVALVKDLAGIERVVTGRRVR